MLNTLILWIYTTYIHNKYIGFYIIDVKYINAMNLHYL